MSSSERSAEWSFNLGRSSYRRGVPQISAGGIAPTFGGCAFVPLNKRGHMYFQHDRAPPHSSCEVRNLLYYRFLGQLIRRSSPHNWPARSPDLSPLGYCVWEWMKELVYCVKVVMPDALLGRIFDAADRTRNSQWKLQRATCAVHNRAADYVAAGGGIFENQL